MQGRGWMTKGRLATLLAALVVACSDWGGPGARTTVSVTIIGGDAQSGYPGHQLRDSLRIRVADNQGRPMVGELVLWSATAGWGSVAPDSGRTDATGVATAQWTLGHNLADGQPWTGSAVARVADFHVSFTATATVGSWNWQSVDVPTDDMPLSGVIVDPADDRVWYAWGWAGLFVTHDAGTSWTKAPFVVREEFPYYVFGGRSVVLDPSDTRRVYAAHDTTLYASLDRGLSWKRVATLSEFTASMHVSPNDGALYIAPHWPLSSEQPVRAPGVYRWMDGDESLQHLPFGIPLGTAVITWQIAEHPATGALFLANEIADHPVPYNPPFLRSRDRGVTWENVAPSGWWHASAVQVAPDDGTVYALLEGGSVWKSSDLGNTWSEAGATRTGTGLLLDPEYPHRLFVADVFVSGSRGGLYLSVNRGERFWEVGFAEMTVGDLALTRGGAKLIVIAHRCLICPSAGAGLYVADVPSHIP
jgi:hypothetical protein